MKIVKTKPRKGPNALQMVIRSNIDKSSKKKSVESKKKEEKKQCNTTTTTTTKDKKIMKKEKEQADFLLFLENEKKTKTIKNENN